VAHVCPSYSGGRDQEERGQKPAQINSLRDPILKKTFTKKGARVGLGVSGRVAGGVGPEFKPQYHKKKKS
jgi:hypothetical protein